MSRSLSRSGRNGGVVVLAAALVLSVVAAAPSFAAPEKIWSINAPSSIPSGPQTINLTVKNETPTGNSSINSLTISHSNGVLSIVDVYPPSGTLVDKTATGFSISNLPPLKNGKSLTIAVDVVATPSDGCTGSVTWGGQAWTGSSFSGDEFRLLTTEKNKEGNLYSQLVTNVSAGCYLAWSPAPADGTVGSTISVGVKVYNGNNVEVTNNRSVSLSVPGASVTGSPDTTHPFSFSVSGSTAGQYTATASASGMTSITANFTLYDTNSSISGQKWRDHDNDGVKDADERGLEGWLIKAYDDSGAVAGSATTAADDSSTTGVDESGDYTISGLTAGESYTVCEFSPAEEDGFEYRGWIQSVPSANTLCDGKTSGNANFEDAEPNGYTVDISGPTRSDVTGKDFFNVRTITIPEHPTIELTCDIDGPTTYTVGDGTNEPYAEVTVKPGECKPGEYVFESWISGGEQTVAFYPTFPKTGTLVPIEQHFEWVIDGDKTQSNLYYDDDVPGVPERKMLFCNVVSDGADGWVYDSMPAPVAPDADPHTTCLMSTTEVATTTGVYRVDITITLVDGTVRRK